MINLKANKKTNYYFLFYIFFIIFLSIIFVFNVKAKDTDIQFEIIEQPIEFKIYNNVFSSKESVDNFLSKTRIDTNTLNSLGLIESENGFQIIKGGKYYQTFYKNTDEKSYEFYFILLLIFIILFLTALCLYVVFYFKWKKLDETKLVTFPEKAVGIMETFQKEHIHFKNQLSEHIKDTTSQLSSVIQEIEEEINKLNAQVKEFRKFTEKKGEELQRYKDGYDYSNLKSLILGLIDNIKFIEKNITNQEITSSPLLRYFEASKDKLDLLLQSRGIEKFTPEIGKPITEVIGCLPVDTVITKEKNQINNIAEVVQDGFKINIDENNIKIIKEAEVKVYKGEENE